MKRRVNAAAAGAATGLVGVTGVSAQSLRDRFFGGDEVAPDIASAGNGGVVRRQPTAAVLPHQHAASGNPLASRTTWVARSGSWWRSHLPPLPTGPLAPSRRSPPFSSPVLRPSPPPPPLLGYFPWSLPSSPVFFFFCFLFFLRSPSLTLIAAATPATRSALAIPWARLA